MVDRAVSSSPSVPTTWTNRVAAWILQRAHPEVCFSYRELGAELGDPTEGRNLWRAVSRMIRYGFLRKVAGHRGSGPSARTVIVIEHQEAIERIAGGENLLVRLSSRDSAIRRAAHATFKKPVQPPPPPSWSGSVHLRGTSTPRGSGGSGVGAWCLREEDLQNPESLRQAFSRACRAGLIEFSEAARIRFAAAVARARRLARDVCRFVAAFVRGKVPWSYITQADEDAGRQLLKERNDHEDHPRDRSVRGSGH